MQVTPHNHLFKYYYSFDCSLAVMQNFFVTDVITFVFKPV